VLIGLASLLLVTSVLAVIRLGHQLAAEQPPSALPEVAVGSTESGTPAQAAGTAQPQEAEGPDPVVFSTSPQRPNRTPVLLPAETNAIYCFFQLVQAPAGDLSVRWSLGGQDLGPLQAPTQVQRSGGTISGQLTLSPPGRQPQFAPGIYVVDFLLGGQPFHQASFVAARQAAMILASKPLPTSEVRVANPMTVAQVGPDGWPVTLAEQFRPTDKIWVWFGYVNGAPGTAFTVSWYCGRTLIPQATTQVPMQAESGWGLGWIQPQQGQLPAGGYEAVITAAGPRQRTLPLQTLIDRDGVPKSVPIRVRKETRDRLHSIKNPGQTLDGIITQLIDLWERQKLEAVQPTKE
jgi:hypothetical protein